MEQIHTTAELEQVENIAEEYLGDVEVNQTATDCWSVVTDDVRFVSDYNAYYVNDHAFDGSDFDGALTRFDIEVCKHI